MIEAISGKINQLFVGGAAIKMGVGSIKRTFVEQMFDRKRDGFSVDCFKKIAGSGTVGKRHSPKEKERGNQTEA